MRAYLQEEGRIKNENNSNSGGGTLLESRIQTAGCGDHFRGTRVLRGFRRTNARAKRNATDLLLSEKGEAMKSYEIPCLTFVAVDAADLLRTSGEGPNETPKIDLLDQLNP